MSVPNSLLPPTILLVDDDIMTTELFAEILGQQYHCHTANSIAQARNILDQENISLVLSDYHIGMLDAGELFSWLSLHHPALMTRFILLTGDQVSDLSRFEQQATIMFKPVQVELLLQTVDRLIQQSTEAIL